MGRPRTDQRTPRSHTLPSSPTHSFSSSSSEFEFMTISLSPRKSSASSALIPADELFYKGQLLPLHLSPRLSMVRTLLHSSSSTSSSTSTATGSSRPSTDSSSSSRPSSATDSDSSRPSSAAEDDELKRLHSTSTHEIKKPNKRLNFSLSRFSSVFRVKESKTRDPDNTSSGSSSSVKRVSVTAKEVFRKYLKKVKPLYEKLSSQKAQQQKISANFSLPRKAVGSVKEREISLPNGTLSHSFSGNLKYPRMKSVVSSCPSSMRSSPSHSGVLYRNGFPGSNPGRDASSMEELQSAIQGAIAHCKNSMVENKSMVSNEI